MFKTSFQQCTGTGTSARLISQLVNAAENRFVPVFYETSTSTLDMVQTWLSGLKIEILTFFMRFSSKQKNCTDKIVRTDFG
jgi:hypothetical protein